MQWFKRQLAPTDEGVESGAPAGGGDGLRALGEVAHVAEGVAVVDTVLKKHPLHGGGEQHVIGVWRRPGVSIGMGEDLYLSLMLLPDPRAGFTLALCICVRHLLIPCIAIRQSLIRRNPRLQGSLIARTRADESRLALQPSGEGPRASAAEPSIR